MAPQPLDGRPQRSSATRRKPPVLTFTEELVLLLNDGDGRPLPVRQDVVACALAGAVLMDLAFDYRIDTDLEALVVHDPTPTGNPALDGVLARITAHTGMSDTKAWIGRLSAEEAPAIHEKTLAGLVERRILAARAHEMPWMRSRHGPGGDGKAAKGIRLHIANVLGSTGIPDPRDVALVSLLDACGILPDLFAEPEMENFRPRIGQLRKMDLIGREVAGAVADIERSIIQAVRARAEQSRKLLLAFSMAACLAATATWLSPRVPVPDRFGPSVLESLWFDSSWQLWSGYVLLGLSGAGLLAALLWKVRAIARLGGYHGWRLAHVGLGIGCVLVLFAHTGFRFGIHFNAALMGCFLAVLILGGLAGVCSHAAGLLRKMGIRPAQRIIPMRLHRLALYPLPALVIIHVLTVYLY